MSFRGYALRLHIPVETLGRLRVPTTRLRIRWGWVRFTWAPARDKVIVTLEDREGLAIRFKNITQVRALAKYVGVGACYALRKWNRYEAGEDTGDQQKIMVSWNPITKRPYQSQLHSEAPST